MGTGMAWHGMQKESMYYYCRYYGYEFNGHHLLFFSHPG